MPIQEVVRRAPIQALAGWVLVDWALQPFHTLVVTFLFAPYFASEVVGNAVRGQELWGYAAAIAGLAIAVGGPPLGAIADHSGRRKPWVALTAIVMAAAASMLWLARPAADTATILIVLAAFMTALMASEFTTVFTNSLMPTLVPKSELGRLSGASWSVAFTGGLVSLIVVAGFLVANPGSGRTFLDLAPLFPLDAASREGDRLVGPFVAIWLLVFLLPFFLFVPDVGERSSGEPLGAVVRSSFSELLATLRTLPSQPDILWFLVARALYTDGLSAIFVFGGIYGTTVFGWGLPERGMFGILLIVLGIIGAAIGGVLDDRLGSKRVIIGALTLLVIGAIGIVSVTATHVAFVIPIVPRGPASVPLSSPGELAFLAFAGLVAIAAAPNQSASRTLLARLAPPDRIAQYFGLFAFSGKATAFLAPLVIALVTSITASQRIGIATILVFLIAGIALLLPVRERMP
jgi:UMF1 family MFS transporter